MILLVESAEYMGKHTLLCTFNNGERRNFEAKNQEAEERAMFVAAFKAIQATQREKQVSVRLSNVEANTDDYNRGWCYSNFRGYCSNYCGD